MLLHLLVVPLEDLDGVSAIFEATTEGLLLDQLVVQPRGRTYGRYHLGEGSTVVYMVFLVLS